MDAGTRFGSKAMFFKKASFIISYIFNSISSSFATNKIFLHGNVWTFQEGPIVGISESSVSNLLPI